MDFRLRVCHLDRWEQWEKLAEPASWKAGKLAKIVGVSLRTLERYFEEDLARRPREWLTEQRMIKARELLQHGQSIKETAHALGFKHLSHFHHQFKKVHGTTPSAYKPR